MFLFKIFLVSFSLIPRVFTSTYYFESKLFDTQNTLFDNIKKEQISEAASLASLHGIQNIPSITSLFGAIQCLLTLDNYFQINLPDLKYPVILRTLTPSLQYFGSNEIVEQRYARIA